MTEQDGKLTDLDTKMWQMQGQIERLRDKMNKTIAAYVQEKSDLRDEVAEMHEHVTSCFTTIATLQTAMLQMRTWDRDRVEEIEAIRGYITSKFGYKFDTHHGEEIPF